MRLHFDLALVRRLLEHSKTATGRRPSYDQLYEGRFRRDGQDADLDNLTTGNFPTADDVDPSKIPPGLWLVGDTGIYLMSNGHPALPVDRDTNRDIAAYAAEADPTTGINIWREAKRAAFGGDDGVVFLDLWFVEGLIARGTDGRVCMTLTPHQIEAIIPDVPSPNTPLALPPPPLPRRQAGSRRAGRAAR